MLHLNIQSLDGTQYDWPVKQITVPTLSGQITILPGHQPLVTICMTGLMKIIPPEIDDSLLGRYIITDKVINLSISQWVLQVEWDQVSIVSAQATSSPTESLEILEKNKSDLLAKLETIKVDQNSDVYEDILNDIQKIDADIKLSKLR
jgi:F0F1-type ATP synthase epsilon subunit